MEGFTWFVLIVLRADALRMEQKSKAMGRQPGQSGRLRQLHMGPHWPRLQYRLAGLARLTC